MKRLRIWFARFNLVQQFLTIVFFIFVVFVVFAFTSLNQNINRFINTQMFNYLHKSQYNYLLYRDKVAIKDANAYHFYLNKKTKETNEHLSFELAEVINSIPLENNNKEVVDGVIYRQHTSYIYSIRHFDNEYCVISLLKDNYRKDYEKALFDGVINITLVVVFLLFLLMIIWIYSLIRPLNQIKVYIDSIREGKDKKLRINRGDEIGEVAEALSDMQHELNCQKAIREEMIQNISHDLKTPIATIKSYSESIKDGIYPYDTLEKSVDVIFEHADRLEKRVYSLITYNKMGYLKDNELNGKSVKMLPLIKKTIMALGLLRNDIVINTNLKPTTFVGDEDAWRVVIENFLDNALRYSKSVVVITLDNDYLSVYNDGNNMSQEQLNKLFQPYQKGEGGNFGLGLSIVKRVTDTYGYYVVGENTPNGVIFEIKKNKKNKKRGSYELLNS